MILITGANGKSGRAVINALLSKGEDIRALVHKAEQIQGLKSLGVTDVISGDMLDQKTMNEAFKGAKTVYHICSAINPNEVKIGQIAINAAIFANVEHFVYQSALHSIFQDLPHHQKKLIVEELLVNSGIPYTILQPAAFMQNILESLTSLTEKGIFQQKFFTTKETRMCLVDLDDLAEAAALILTNPGHTGATYEICGPENLSLDDMLFTFEKHFGREIKVAKAIPDELWIAQLTNHGVSQYQINTLLKMFKHYNEHGFIGNSNVLSWIIGRKPNNFSSFILRTIHL